MDRWDASPFMPNGASHLCFWRIAWSDQFGRQLVNGQDVVIHVRAMPLVWASPVNSMAKGRTRGIALIVKSLATAGRSHRLTSGGKAVPDIAHDF